MFLLLPPPLFAVAGALVHYSPRTLPHFYWHDAKGTAHTLEEYRGKVVIINIWATWCTPCVREMPDLATLQKRYEKGGLQIITISQDLGGFEEASATIARFYNELSIANLPVFIDYKQSSFKALGARGLPHSVIIDKAGNDVGRIEGFTHWDRPSITGFIEELLAQ